VTLRFFHKFSICNRDIWYNDSISFVPFQKDRIDHLSIFSENILDQITTDVIVVGGGPSGSIAARTLARSGKDVVLIEKNPHNDKPCGGGLFVRAFDEFELPHSLIEHTLNTIRVGYEDRVIDVELPPSDPLGIVSRRRFDAALRNQAEIAGAHLIYGKAETVRREEGGISVTVRTNKRRLTIRAPYLIAADGVHSTVRKQVLGETPSRVLTYYQTLHGKEESSTCTFWFGSEIAKHHYGWHFPKGEGSHVGLIGDTPAEMPRQFAHLLRRIGYHESVTPKPKGYFIPYWKPLTLYRDGVLFVGDSASLVLPFTYEGIYYAMASGRLAAQSIIDNRPQAYPKIWNERYRKKFLFLRLLQKIFLRNDRFVSRMIELYSLPKFQRAVIEYWSGKRKPEGFFRTVFKAVKAIYAYK
jgi:geranylgeranyl reductase